MGKSKIYCFTQISKNYPIKYLGVMFDNKFFAKNLRTIRDVWGMNQNDFGELFRLTRSNVANIEQKKQNPPIGFAYDLALATDFELMELLSRELLSEEIPDSPGGNRYQSPYDKIEKRLKAIEEMIRNMNPNG
jgi:transcriptional regulator with XRE-family HTH domain